MPVTLTGECFDQEGGLGFYPFCWGESGNGYSVKNTREYNFEISGGDDDKGVKDDAFFRAQVDTVILSAAVKYGFSVEEWNGCRDCSFGYYYIRTEYGEKLIFEDWFGDNKERAEKVAAEASRLSGAKFVAKLFEHHWLWADEYRVELEPPSEAKDNIRDSQPEWLNLIVTLSMYPGSVVAFDLDSTLLDQRSRYVAVIQEFGRLHNLQKTADLAPNQLRSSWLTDEDLAKLGIPQNLVEDFRKFWKEHFFSGEYCTMDAPNPGAVEYVKRVRAAGAMVVYQSGRSEAMREGTNATLSKFGFPVGDGTSILLKADPSVSDAEYKQQLVQTLKGMGRVVAVFDNEPENVNIFASGLPGTLVVFINTDHSFKDIEPAKNIPWINNFLSSTTP